MTSNANQPDDHHGKRHDRAATKRVVLGQEHSRGLQRQRSTSTRSRADTQPDAHHRHGRRWTAWHPFKPHQTIPGTGYRVIEQRSVGGMGEIYEVRDEHGATAAMKVLSSHLRGRTDLVNRMLDEGCALRLIRHANLVRWLDSGVLDGGRPYLVTELLQGHTLRSHIRRFGSVPPSQARRWLVDLLMALDAIHQAELVHCDVKPDNVFLCDNGSIKLLDLGAAEPIRDDRPAATLPPIGTPRYMAPEQLAAHGVDARTDVFAAGLVLAELLYGRWPFGDARGADAAARLARDGPGFGDQCPDLWAAITCAAATRPNARYANALAMARSLCNLPSRPAGPLARERGSDDRRPLADQ